MTDNPIVAKHFGISPDATREAAERRKVENARMRDILDRMRPRQPDSGRG